MKETSQKLQKPGEALRDICSQPSGNQNQTQSASDPESLSDHPLPVLTGEALLSVEYENQYGLVGYSIESRDEISEVVPILIGLHFSNQSDRLIFQHG